MTTARAAGAAARQLLLHRERIRWMERRIEHNEAVLTRYIEEHGDAPGGPVPLPGGFVASFTPEGGVCVERVYVPAGYEQLRIEDAA